MRAPATSCNAASQICSVSQADMSQALVERISPHATCAGCRSHPPVCASGSTPRVIKLPQVPNCRGHCIGVSNRWLRCLSRNTRITAARRRRRAARPPGPAAARVRARPAAFPAARSPRLWRRRPAAPAEFRAEFWAVQRKLCFEVVLQCMTHVGVRGAGVR